MNIQLDIDGLTKIEKRDRKKYNDYGREPMSAKLKQHTVAQTRNRQLVQRALAAYFADEAKDFERQFAATVGLYYFGEEPCRFGEDEPHNIDDDVLIMGGIYGQVDNSRKLPIVTINNGEENIAKYRYNPKSDKLSRIR